MTDSELLQRLSTEVSSTTNMMLEMIQLQQVEIDRLTSLLTAQRASAQRHVVITSLIDNVTLKPIGTCRGEGVVVVPKLPLILENGREGATIFDEETFDLGGISDAQFIAPCDIREPWIGMFDAVTWDLVVVYKFRAHVARGDSLHVTFKSKMVLW